MDRDVSIYRHFLHYFFLTFQDCIFRDKCTERQILSLIIKCPSEGCEWTGELREKEVSIETEWCVQLTVGCPACWLFWGSPIIFFWDTGFPLFETQDSGLQISSEGWMPKITIGLRDWKTLLEGVNGVNRLATQGKKYYRLPTKREKNYRLPTGKILTHYRHGPTLSIFSFQKGEYIV